MKRCLCLLLSLLLVALCAGAGAEAGYVDLKARDVVLNRYTDILGCRFDGSDYYCLIRPDGTKITEELYRSMRGSSDAPYFRVEGDSQDGIHDEGVIDAEGRVLVPPVYADVTIVSDRWIYGVKLVPSTADDKDYTFSNWSTGEKTFHRIDSVDFYYRGQLVGTLSRSDCDGYPSAYGDYICVQKRDRSRVFYNSAFQKSPVEAEYSGEYTSSYRKGRTAYIHNGSGQAAFEAGCTLTADEVDQSIVYDNGKFRDLQGNEPFPAAQNYDSVNRFQDGYAVARMNRLSGIVDMTGREVIPLEYEDVGDYTSHPFRFGVISAVKDGKFGYLDLAGNVTCPFTYSKDIVRNFGCLATIKDLDGSIIVLSGLAGVLPEHYAEVNARTGARAFTAKDADGKYCLIDADGTVLIPYTETYSIEANDAATVACANLGGRTYRVWTIARADAAQPSAGGTENGEDTNNSTTAPGTPAEAPAEDGSWTCSNGHSGNTGLFCPTCGEKKPDDEIICPGCGTHYPAAEAPNFCPNDGTKLK